jgi:hypothetical protein
MGIVASAARGAVAGIVATAAMDLVWYRRYRTGGGEESLLAWEFSAATDGFDEAPAPARVGRRAAATVGVDLPDEWAGTTNDVVHWMTGIGWGKFAALVVAVTPVPRPLVGLATGVVAWGTSYAVLPPLGIYDPISHYDRETLSRDLTAHLVFGSALGVALMVLHRSDR